MDKKYKILIVDDDKFLLDMYTIKFKEKGFDVHSVFGGVNAIFELRKHNDFDVVIMDVVMPSMDGFELLSEIKKEKLAENAKIVILSNLGQPSDIEKGEKLGADGYIIKASSTPAEVVSKIMGLIEK